ncbi:DUF72 domain-containing protein [Galbitalea sp. SE-J8]|uniref:DUF72 domain-containing protein n=1 Tax=Galbitalea sp. SE-J8 TaxID=3054952 RepID=UPI00259CB002|nr:DUF72 domain-containing protein [Galbitalea sp. SE-J8]MDM4761778.1 DUF72 domain-containing protein [Galbitalea sp. SE-J8]
MRGRSHIGISGWRYPRWRGDFYPAGLVQRRELAYAAERVDAIELNGSFYALQRASSFRAWRAEVPAGTVFAVKGSRYITHLLRLGEVDVALANFFAQGVLALGPALGPILWQLPARQAFDAELLDRFLARLPRTTTDAARLARGHDARVRDPWPRSETDAGIRYALEVRHASFDTDSAAALLARHGVALAIADTAGRFPDIRRETGDFDYVRLHGDTELYASGYSGAALDAWAAELRGRLDRGRDAYVFFDNDARGRAPWDAVGLRERLRD